MISKTFNVPDDNIFKDSPLPQVYSKSGLKILTVGGGIGGLSFAIEAHRKGHEVQVIDRRPNFDDYGDLIAVQKSAIQTPRAWPDFLKYAYESGAPSTTDIYTHEGNYVSAMETFALSTTRHHLHKLLYDYVLHLGIPVQFSAQVLKYFEDSEQAGVILEDGEKLYADIVVAADGIGSRSWSLVSGHKEKTISSGYAMFRNTFPLEHAMKNPVFAKAVSEGRAHSELIFGPGAHMVMARTKDQCIYLITHKDNEGAVEDWNATVDASKALPYVENWEPWVKEMIKSTPPNSTIDWKLMWRNPREKWSSPHARVIQLGDAAHTFLPTSAAGATMAMEDAYCLATCLQLGGKQNAPLAVRVHNKLRFERVTLAQKQGYKNRETLHETTSAGSQIFSPKWIIEHDPEQYAYEMYGLCANSILTRKEFANTNGVPGHTFKMWTVEEMREAKGDVGDDGDWS